MLVRYDCFIIWGNAEKEANEIIDLLGKENDLDIVLIEKKRVTSIKKFVRQVYSFDYAPLSHLKEKVRYLNKTSNNLHFVFVRNKNPEIDFFGINKFRHLECRYIKSLKTEIREIYNAHEENGKISHNHVVHATDNMQQTDQLLKLIGYKKGIDIFTSRNINETPFYISEPDEFTIEQVKIEDIRCVNFIKSKNYHPKIKYLPINESIQYLGIDTPNLYKEYLNEYRGTGLKQYYSLERFQNLFSIIRNGQAPKPIILVRNYRNKLIIIDGLHRASIQYYLGHKNIKAIIYDR